MPVARDKILSLDGLRGIAALLVVLHHVHSFLPVVNYPTFYLDRYASLGWIGVDLFFVLSGFLITGILLDTREASNYFSGFYARRLVRIFPLYYAVLIGLLSLGWISSLLHVRFAPDLNRLLPLSQDRWVYFSFLTNWLGLWKAQWDVHFASILAHFWSLAIEEQFYLVWPLLVWVMPRRAVPWVAAALALGSGWLRHAWAADIGAYGFVLPVAMKVQFATVCRLDGLLLGAICACVYRNQRVLGRVRKWLPWVATAGLGAFFVVVSVMNFNQDFTTYLIYGSDFQRARGMEDAVRYFSAYCGYSLLAIGFAALVLLAAVTDHQRTWMQRGLKSRMLARVGKYSYGIYVFHVPLVGLCNLAILPRVHLQSHAQVFLFSASYIGFILVASFGIAGLSYEFFEKRFLRLKRNFEPRIKAFQYEGHEGNEGSASRLSGRAPLCEIQPIPE